MTTTDIKLKYTSRAAILYKDKLAQQANAALKSYSGSIHLELGSNSAESNDEIPSKNSSSKPQADFFTEIESSHPKDSSSAADVDPSAVLFCEPQPVQPQQSFAVPGSTSLASTGAGETAAAPPASKKVSSLGSKKPVSRFVLSQEQKVAFTCRDLRSLTCFSGNSFS